MGIESYVLAGVSKMSGSEQAFVSACHGAGRQMSRTEARSNWRAAPSQMHSPSEASSHADASLRGVG
ncbi:RtcB family protein [Cupriavidus basilensis]|uniref:RtcB family protein n=1 Tax=Cupriavidus basilensis TaxID=68895 RepID=UPI003D3426B6